MERVDAEGSRAGRDAPSRAKVPPRGWMERPVGRGWVLLLGLVILAGPVVLWADPLDGYLPKGEGAVGLVARIGRVFTPLEDSRIIGDDFDYLAEARTPAELRRNLWVAHNSHVVPLFRAWTFFWMEVAGSLAGVPRAFAAASLLTYLAAALLVGWVVGRETGRAALGLVSMAVFGVSAVLEDTVRWYSAGQAIASGVCLLAMLASLQSWRRLGGRWRLLGAALAAGAAPLVWTIGLIAGPVGFVYLWTDGRTRAKWGAFAPMAATAVVAATVFGLAGKEVTASKNFHGRGLAEAASPSQGLLSTAQATAEVLAFGNLGLAAETTPAQAMALVVLLMAAWAWTRGRPWKFAPLEAAGASTVLLGFALVYTARGYYPYEQLRDLHWYHAVPQVGAVLFVAGWWSGRDGGGAASTGRRGMTRGEALVVVGALAIAQTLQAPRVRDNLLASVPPMTASEQARFPIATLQRLRARYLVSERAGRQRRDFARLDQAEARARSEGWSRDAIRAALGGPTGPKLSIGFAKAVGFDPVALLALPETGPKAPLGPIRAALLPLLTPEPEPRPPWLAPADPWP